MKAALVIAVGGAIVATVLAGGRVSAGRVVEAYDPVVAEPARMCRPNTSGPPALWKNLVLAKTETTPFQPVPMKAAGGEVPLYKDLGTLSFRITTASPRAQAYFDQGLRWAFAFNHAEAQRAFQAAQKLDPECAMCYWGEALVLGPNINAPMAPEANAPAIALVTKARARSAGRSARENMLVEALAKRYSEDPLAKRPELDAYFADAMKAVAERFADDDTIQVLYAESIMDTQPWDYWEAAGAKPKGRTAELVATLEKVLARNPGHAGAIHLYIHAMEASTRPEKALPHARRLARLMPGAGHIVHMPAHIYYRVGMYRESLEANKAAIKADEKYFATSPSDPMYRSAYYPHNIHFVVVSAQMGGDGRTAIEAAGRLEASISDEIVRKVAALQPIKAAPYTTHAQFSDAATILSLAAPDKDFALMRAMHHYARALAFAMRKDSASARKEIAAIEAIEKQASFKAFEEWGVPGKEIVQTARLVAAGRVAAAEGDLEAAAKSYEAAIAIEDSLAYMEPPYWYYPIRQSLGAVRLRQGRLDEARQAFRDSLGRVRNNGWALAGLAEVYRRSGDAKSEKSVREALSRTWFGAAKPDLERL